MKKVKICLKIKLYRYQSLTLLWHNKHYKTHCYHYYSTIQITWGGGE